MLGTSATKLYVEDGVVKCGGAGRSGGKCCGRPVVIDGRVMHAGKCTGKSEFTIAELMRAMVDAGQTTIGELLDEFYGLVVVDPLASYRNINGLVLLGDREIEAALRATDGSNPLNLSDNWCRQQIQQVPLPTEWTPQVLTNLVERCKTEEWSGPAEVVDKYGLCRPVLTFEPATVGSEPISFERMYEWWGFPHDGGKPGMVRQNVQYSNWAINQGLDWAQHPLLGGWRMYYQPTPYWVRRKNWADQQSMATKKYKLTMRSAPEYTWMMDLWRANGLSENSLWARTTTPYGSYGWPFNARFDSDGVFLDGGYYPGHAFGSVGAAVEGVPLALVF